MADHEPKNSADPQYEETTAPQNPPNSLVRPRVRRGLLATSLGTVIALFTLVAAMLGWVIAQRGLGYGPLHRSDPQTIGTAGTRDERIRNENTPGGVDTAPRFGSTEDELKFRGANETTVARLKEAASGSRVHILDVHVERAEGDTFTIRDGETRATVVVPGGMPTVRPGQRVNVSGTIETGGATPRIRASRIDVR